MLAASDLRVRNYDAGFAMAPHDHAETSIGIVIAGGLLERIGARERNYVRGHVSLFPAGFVHSQLFGALGACQIIVTPEASWLDYLAECGLRLSDAPYARSTVLRTLGDRLLEEICYSDGYSALAREGILLELVAAFGRADARGCERAAAPKWLRRTREYLDANLEAPVSMRALARVAERHEIHVAREFRRFFGASVGEYVRQLRTERAARLLLESEDSISAIAFDCGFANHSHLCREFRRRFGVTPAQYRAQRRPD